MRQVRRRLSAPARRRPGKPGRCPAQGTGLPRSIGAGSAVSLTDCSSVRSASNLDGACRRRQSRRASPPARRPCLRLQPKHPVSPRQRPRRLEKLPAHVRRTGPDPSWPPAARPARRDPPSPGAGRLRPAPGKCWAGGPGRHAQRDASRPSRWRMVAASKLRASSIGTQPGGCGF